MRWWRTGPHYTKPKITCSDGAYTVRDREGLDVWKYFRKFEDAVTFARVLYLHQFGVRPEVKPAIDRLVTWEELWILTAAEKNGWPDDEKNLLEPFVVPSDTQFSSSICFRGIYSVNPKTKKSTGRLMQFMALGSDGFHPAAIFDGPYKNVTREKSPSV